MFSSYYITRKRTSSIRGSVIKYASLGWNVITLNFYTGNILEILIGIAKSISSLILIMMQFFSYFYLVKLFDQVNEDLPFIFPF